MAAKLPTDWLCRAATMDREIAEQVIVRNEYGLPRRFRPDDIIVDVGGHIGSFTYAALVRGAGVVHCYEANPDNVPVLEHNLRPFAGRAVIHHTAMFGANPPSHLYFHRSTNPHNTGGGWVGGRSESATTAVPVVSFDAEVERITNGGRQRIRLLKLDCEGSEWPILLTSRLLHLVDEVCGEYHLPPAGMSPEHNLEALRDHLQRQSFVVRIQGQPGVQVLGLFFARRPAAGAGTLLERLRDWWVSRRAG
jgi:FkbM family methyltransferase